MKRAFLFVAAAAFLLSGFAAALAAAPGPRFVAPVRGFDFGKVKRGATISHCFRVSNAGTGVLKILGMTFTYPGMTARVKALIPPGKTRPLCIDLKTTTLDLGVRARALLRLNDPAHPQIAFTLRGFVSRPIDFIPPAVFATFFKGEGAQKRIEIVNNERKPLAIKGIEREGKHFRAKIVAVKPGRVYDLLVRIPRDTPPGRYIENAQLSTNDPRHPRLRVGVFILVLRDLYAMPEKIDFGTLSLAQLRTDPALAEDQAETVFVREREGSFRIDGVSSDIPGLGVTVSPQGEARAFRVEVVPQPDKLAPGPFAGTVTIATSDRKIPRILVPVRGVVR